MRAGVNALKQLTRLIIIVLRLLFFVSSSPVACAAYIEKCDTNHTLDTKMSTEISAIVDVEKIFVLFARWYFRYWISFI